MPSSSRITDYLGVGVAASRPTTPNLATGCLGLYFATDTLVWSVWNGSAWIGAPAPLNTEASVSFAGTNQAGATAITTKITFITGGTGGVKLSAPVAGQPVNVINTLSIQGTVYPNGSTDVIEANGTTVGVVIAANGDITFWPSSSTQWWAR